MYFGVVFIQSQLMLLPYYSNLYPLFVFSPIKTNFSSLPQTAMSMCECPTMGRASVPWHTSQKQKEINCCYAQYADESPDNYVIMKKVQNSAHNLIS